MTLQLAAEEPEAGPWRAERPAVIAPAITRRAADPAAAGRPFILAPARRDGTVTFRPPRWAEHGREGAISVPAGRPLLVIEGVGTGRRKVAGLIDALVWVQSDEAATRRRSLARRGARRPAGCCGPARVDERGSAVPRARAALGAG